MTIYVDALMEHPATKDADARRVGARHGHRWCHLFTDGPEEELHAFALRIGLKREWFQAHEKLPHYDLTPPRRKRALYAGAVEADRRKVVELIRRWRAQSFGFPSTPYQPGDGDRNERDLRRLRGRYGGPLAEDREPDLVEMMERAVPPAG